MNFYLSIGALTLMLVLSIFKNYRSRSLDKILLVLEPSTFSKFNISFFACLSAFFGALIILNKGTFQVNIFWFVFSTLWFYLLRQKKVVLEKGIGLRDFFRNSSYTVPFSDISDIEKGKKNTFIIKYTNNNKGYKLKIYVPEESVNQFMQLIRKKTKLKVG